MKKNLLTLLIILLSVIYGGNNLSAQNVAKVGNTEYATIDEAIANWTNNTTLTLLKNVTLSDVINLSSKEYHVLDLGTYTMTAASGKDAINIVNNGLTSASYTLDIKADATSPGGIIATGKAIVRHSGSAKDRPITRFYNGIFTASYIINHSGNSGSNSPYFYFYDGEYNGTIYSSRSTIIFEGGTFNGNLQLSVDSSAYTLVKGGKFKKFSNLAGSSLTTGNKFTVGYSKGIYDNGVYVDEDGYLVIGGGVIEGYNVKGSFNKDYNGYTERYHYNNNNSYLTYSSAKVNGLYYDNIKKLLDDNTSQTVWVHQGTLDLTAEKNAYTTFTGTIKLPKEDSEFTVKYKNGYAPTLDVTTDITDGGKGVAINENTVNGITTRVYRICEQSPCTHVARIIGNHYASLNEAASEANDGDVITLMKDTQEVGLELNENVTIDFNNFTYTATSGITVAEGKTITLQNGTITSSAPYVISTSGNLTIQDMTINGTIEYLGGEMFTDQSFNVSAKKYFEGVGTGHTQNWSTISTPIANAAIPEATAGIHDLYRFDEPEQEWEYYNDADGLTFEKLVLGRGYLYANAEDITFELTGSLNTSSVEFSLSFTSGNSLAGFNMIGNPFTHTISKSNLSTSATLANGFYVVGANGTWTAKADGKIAPMESVLIQANGKGTLTMSPANTGSKRAARNENSYLTINVASKTHSDVAYVSFNDGMGLDKINHRNPDNPMLYIPVEGKNYAIAMMDKDVKEVPVYFNANRMAEYTISIEQNNCEFNTMTLVDKLTGIETNMLIEDYTFMARTFDDANRFVIRMSIEDNDDSETENFAYVSNGSIVIEKIEGNANIRIFDIMGRHIMGTNATGNANIPVETMSTGMYIIQMSDDNGVKVQKIIIE